MFPNGIYKMRSHTILSVKDKVDIKCYLYFQYNVIEKRFAQVNVNQKKTSALILYMEIQNRSKHHMLQKGIQLKNQIKNQ